MKKLLAIALALVMLIGACACFASCENGREESSTSGEQSSESSSESRSEGTDSHEQTSSESKSETESESKTETKPVETTEEQYPFDPDEETEGEQTEDGGSVNTNCHPRYATDAGSHWSPACETCGKVAGKKIAHSIYCTVEDEGDVILYSYFCKRCDMTVSRIEVPYDTAMYFDPSYIIEGSHNFGDEACDIVSYDGLAAARYTSKNGTGNKVTVYADSGNAIATGNYMVIKIKLNAGRSQFRIGISSVQSCNDHLNLEDCVFTTMNNVGSGWSTAIIDVSKLTDDDLGYTASADGEHYLCELSLFVDGVATGEYFDIAHIAFLETLEDAKNFAKSENVTYLYADAMESPDPELDGTPCDHGYTHPDANHHYSEPCDVCFDEGGEIMHKYNLNVARNDEGKITRYNLTCGCGKVATDVVISEDINLYTAPSEITITNWWHGYTYGSAYVDGNDVYQRLYIRGDAVGDGATMPLVSGGGDVNRTNDAIYFTEMSGGAGRYAVLRLRTHDVEQLCLRIATRAGDEDTTFAPDGYPNNRMWEYNDEWVTVVIDLEALKAVSPRKTPYSVGDANVTQMTAGFQICCIEDFSEPYIDLAYFAICDTVEEIASLVPDENVYITAWAANSPMNSLNLKTGELTCRTCMPELSVSEDERVYTVTCSVCGSELSVKSFENEINFYSLPGQYMNNWATGGLAATGAVTGTVRIDEGGFMYSEIAVLEGGSFQMVKDPSAYVREWKSYSSVKGGSGRYAVFKVRARGISTLGLVLSDGLNSSFNADWHLTSRNANDVMDYTWRTYVVDMKAVGSPYYTANADNCTQILAALKVSGVDEKLGGCVDIAYFAICDDWDEIAEVACDEDKIYFTSWAATAELVEMGIDGGCVNHVPKFDSYADGVCSYVCSVCDKPYRTVEAPEGVNYYSAPGQYYNIWNAGTSGNSTSNALNDLRVDEEGGFLYTSIRLYQGASFEMTNGTSTVIRDVKDCSDTIVGGSGRYLVFKIRCDESNSLLNIMLADGKKATQAGEQMRPASIFEGSDGEWHVYVVDLVELGHGCYGANDAGVKNVAFGFKGEAGANDIQGTERLDLAYFAVCDDWTEVARVVGDEQVIYTNWKDGSIDKICNSDGTDIIAE